MPNLKPLFALLALTLVSSLPVQGVETSSLVERDWKSPSFEETRLPCPSGIGPVVEPNGFRDDLNIGPVVEPNGWSLPSHSGFSERVHVCGQWVPFKGQLEVASSTIVEPNG